MTLQKLKDNIQFEFSGYGHWRVYYTTPSGRRITHVTTNSIAIDRIKNENISESDRKTYGITLKQALLAIKP